MAAKHASVGKVFCLGRMGMEQFTLLLLNYTFEPQVLRVSLNTVYLRASLDLRIIPGKWRGHPCLLLGSPVCHFDAQG